MHEYNLHEVCNKQIGNIVNEQKRNSVGPRTLPALWYTTYDMNAV